MLSLKPTFSLLLVRPFNTKLLTIHMMIIQGLTLQLMVFGEEDLRGHTLMSEFLTTVQGRREGGGGFRAVQEPPHVKFRLLQAGS